MVRWLWVSVLMFAAVTKTYQLMAYPGRAARFFGSHWLTVAVIEIHVAVAICLVFGQAGPRARYTATLWFLILSTLSLWKGLAGETSCGCFGEFAISPWVTFALDAAAVVSCSLGESTRPRFRSMRCLAWSLAITLPGIVAVAGVFSAPRHIVSDENGSDGYAANWGGGPICYDPAGLKGQPFLLMRYLEGGEVLGRGSWLAVVYRPDCRRCGGVLQDCDHLSRELGANGNPIRIAAIEIPSPDGRSAAERRAPFITCRLRSRAGGYQIDTPIAVFVQEGIVQASWFGRLPRAAELLGGPTAACAIAESEVKSPSTDMSGDCVSFVFPEKSI
ncbi:MAG TPA: MauE/DoxX family redox-associated membrane protein [Pirellulales bacterium]|nr:MauE/DoxX family redox-associated membrane protein [Pirellulales bacterium]